VNWKFYKVIDGYLGALAQAENDKGKRVFRIVQSTMTSLLKGECLINMTLKRVSFLVLSVCI